jgi:ribose-phosphate pyrophosphokinase
MTVVIGPGDGPHRTEWKIQSRQLSADVPSAFMKKYRSSGQVWGDKIVGEVKDATVVIVDDLISTGGTLARAAIACRRAGAKKVIAFATHGIFAGGADENLGEESLERIVITNTIQPFRLEGKGVKEKVTILNAAPLFAEAIRRLHEGGSISNLSEG